MLDEKKIKSNLKSILEKHRGEIENIKMENVEYDEEFAKIGKKEEEETIEQSTEKEETKEKKKKS